MSTVLDEPPSSPTPSPTPATRPAAKPAKAWYWACAGLILASVIAGLGVWLAGRYRVDRAVDGFARFTAPNTAELRFKRGGAYFIYYEYSGTIDGTKVSAPSTPPAGINLEMRDEAGQSLELRRVGQEFRYDAGGFQGVSLRRVILDRAGLYRLAVTAPGADQFAISVGRGETPSTSESDQLALIIGIAGAALGVVAAITLGVVRSRSRARAAGLLPTRSATSARPSAETLVAPSDPRPEVEPATPLPSPEPAPSAFAPPASGAQPAPDAPPPPVPPPPSPAPAPGDPWAPAGAAPTPTPPPPPAAPPAGATPPPGLPPLPSPGWGPPAADAPIDPQALPPPPGRPEDPSG